eukprot:6982070-Pyramimonas_sp.AAC.1
MAVGCAAIILHWCGDKRSQPKSAAGPGYQRIANISRRGTTTPLGSESGQRSPTVTRAKIPIPAEN